MKDSHSSNYPSLRVGNIDEMLNNPKYKLDIDPLVVLGNLYDRGLELLKVKETFDFYIHSSRSSEFGQLIYRFDDNKRNWRKAVLVNMKDASWMPKKLESKFANNDTILPYGQSQQGIVKALFEPLEADIEVLAEAIDYGKSAQATKQEVNTLPRVKYTKENGFTIDGMKIPLGAKEQTICQVIFANKKLLNKNWLFDELLEEKLELLRSNDLGTVRKIQSAKTRLNKKIAERTPNNIRDVFIGHGSIQLNPKYC